MRIYTKAGCPWCDRAKGLLKAIGTRFEEVDLSDDAKRQAFYDEHGFQGSARSVPKLYRLADGEEIALIGGYKELAAQFDVVAVQTPLAVPA